MRKKPRVEQDRSDDKRSKKRKVKPRSRSPIRQEKPLKKRKKSQEIRNRSSSSKKSSDSEVSSIEERQPSKKLKSSSPTTKKTKEKSSSKTNHTDKRSKTKASLSNIFESKSKSCKDKAAVKNPPQFAYSSPNNDEPIPGCSKTLYRKTSENSEKVGRSPCSPVSSRGSFYDSDTERYNDTISDHDIAQTANAVDDGSSSPDSSNEKPEKTEPRRLKVHSVSFVVLN
jgi:hypothetical protein